MKDNINNIYIGALVIRLIVIAIMLTLSDNLPDGFLSADLINDDVRYLTGAEVYARTAHSIIDVNALSNAFLGIGDYNIAYGDEFKLWYWMISIAMYIFKSHVAVRLINVLFAIFCVKCIYDIASNLYGKKVALLASALYAFMPYPVIFSCFLYKDQFYTLIVLLMLREVLLYGRHLKLNNILRLALFVLISISIRSGFTGIVGLTLVAIFYSYNKNTISKSHLILILLILLSGLSAVIFYSYGSIERKVMAYVVESDLPTSGAISYATIRSFSDLYRFPLALLFSFLMPVNTKGHVLSWADLTGLLNFMVLPVAIGSIIYLINWKYKKDVFFWCIQFLFLVTIITSLGIFRHLYYLQPFMMIMFACFYNSLRKRNKNTFLIVSGILTFVYGIFLTSKF